MFMQVIRGKVTDQDAMRARLDAWQTELRPGATGWLGSTGGALDDGWFIGCVRFESEDAAMKNSDRPEQGAWFAETSRLFDGEPSFINVTDVQPWLDGGSDDAGFVQVMIGHSPDREALRERARQDGDELRAARPEIIGGVEGLFGDDGFVNVAYFRSEEAARKGEAQDPPPEIAERVADFQRLLGDVEFLDIHDPILYSA
jgi:hypothetical protein